MLTATVSEWVAQWPLAFIVGVIVGLLMAQRGYRIIRVKDEHERD
jgi:uncharacterized membrane-anchored protein YhcB (DUF1043 family)